MNGIKGLIIKDLLQLKSYRKTLIIYIVIFILTGLAQENTKGVGSMIALMLILGFGMFSMATFNYDEQAKADRYILTFPLTKKEILLSKYILVVLSTIVGAIIGVVASFIVVYAISKQMPDLQELLYIALGGIFGVGLIEAIQIPCIYKWGAEKGRIQIFIVAASIILLGGGIFFFVEKMDINLPIYNIEYFINQFLPILMLLATFVIYYISYKVAYRIYDKKEI